VFDLDISSDLKHKFRARVFEQLYESVLGSTLCSVLEVPPIVVEIVLMFAYH